MPQTQRPPRRALPAKLQLLIVVAAALVALLAVLTARLAGIPLGGGLRYAKPAKEKPLSGTFRPTKEEWAGLKLGAVKIMSFVPAVSAEGHIATDQDLTTPVFSPYSGRVIEVIAKLGDTVGKGAPLLQVDSSELVEGSDKLVAALSQLKTGQSELKLAELSEKRQHALYLAKGTALKDWQKSQTELSTARDRLRTAEIAVASARQNLRILGNTPQEIAQIESAPPQNADPIAWLRSPIKGTVIARHVGPGQFIGSGGAQPVFTIGNLSTVWLLADVRETDAPLIRLGEPVEVRVLAYPGRSFDAKISWIAPAIDPKTHRLPVRADVKNPGGTLKPMMFAHFRIVIGPAQKAPAVPEGAIVFRDDKKWVWVVAPDGTLAARTIRTGEIRHGMVEVLSGLKAGERIVTGGSLFIDRAARGA
jgi:membrane fusion protein, heavy metal efflux system